MLVLGRRTGIHCEDWVYFIPHILPFLFWIKSINFHPYHSWYCVILSIDACSQYYQPDKLSENMLIRKSVGLKHPNLDVIPSHTCLWLNFSVVYLLWLLAGQEAMNNWVQMHGVWKTHLFIFSLRMRTLLIHLFTVWKPYPFIYWAIIDNQSINLERNSKINTQ